MQWQVTRALAATLRRRVPDVRVRVAAHNAGFVAAGAASSGNTGKRSQNNSGKACQERKSEKAVLHCNPPLYPNNYCTRQLCPPEASRGAIQTVSSFEYGSVRSRAYGNFCIRNLANEPNAPMNVGYWHIADIRGIATFCPLLDRSGHRIPVALRSYFMSTRPSNKKKPPRGGGLIGEMVGLFQPG